MARRRRRSNTSSISNPDAGFLNQPLTRPRVVSDFYEPPFDLTPIEDRRTYHPLADNRDARAWSGHQDDARHVPKAKPFNVQMPFGLQFAAPQNVAVCVRRNRRKEVLHALGKTGGGKGRRKPRKNWTSKIGC